MYNKHPLTNSYSFNHLSQVLMEAPYFCVCEISAGWITDQPPRGPVTEQLLSMAVGSGWEEWKAP